MSNNSIKNGEPQTSKQVLVDGGQSRAKLEDVAWLAGIVDGEGSIIAQYVNTNQKSRYCYHNVSVCVRISNCSMELMEKCQRIIQDITHRKFNLRNHSFNEGKRCFSIDAGAQKAVRKLCTVMLPYLTCKRAQAELAIAFCVSRKEHRHHGSGYTEWEHGVVPEMKRLKTLVFTDVPVPTGVSTKHAAPETSSGESLATTG